MAKREFLSALAVSATASALLGGVPAAAAAATVALNVNDPVIVILKGHSIAYAADPSAVTVPPNVVLFDPEGRVAADSEPQGVANYGHVDVRAPHPGTWTAVIAGIAARSGGYNGTVSWQETTQNYAPFGSISPKSLSLAPGQAKSIAVAVTTPPNPGDLAGSVLLHSASAARSAPATTTSSPSRRAPRPCRPSSSCATTRASGTSPARTWSAPTATSRATGRTATCPRCSSASQDRRSPPPRSTRARARGRWSSRSASRSPAPRCQTRTPGSSPSPRRG